METEMRGFDPFTLEIVKNRLIVLAEEMFITQGRTSKSPIVYEVLDYACALTDSRARLVAQANGVAGFLGALTFAVADVLGKFGDDISPGDVFATNIPYQGGGSHLSDVTMAMPLFHDGRLLAFAVSKAHWTEIGGKDPGSMTNDSTEIYQEGLQLPCIRVYRRGEPIASVIDIIEANVRTPDSTLSDLYAQAAALSIGDRRLGELCDRFGGELIATAMEAILANGEKLARRALGQLPRGVYEATDEIEDDGMGSGAIPVRVRVEITDDCFRVDFTGTGEQAKGSVNCTRVALMAGMRVLYLAIAAPQEPANEGLFAPLEVICPDGTVFTALRPAPTSTYWETRLVASDVVWRALAPELAERLTAGHYLSVCSQVLRTRNPVTGEMALLVEPNAGGWGAGHDRDGADGMFCMGNGETRVLATEVAETRYDVRVDEFAYDIQPGGEGRHRGGRGMVRAYRMLSEGSVTGSFGRSTKGAWGAKGGRPGTPNYIEVVFCDGRPPLRSGKPTRVALVPGDVVRLVTGTGGGWGDPAERPRESIARDLRDGLISRETAEQVYGYFAEGEEA
jgi:N-methylhydantoinase B